MSSLSAFGWLQSSLGIDITGEWNSLVSINVGGCSFSCQRRTFKCCADTSVLCKMCLSNERTVQRTEDGSVIIDRDPETFRHVLNFLRSNQRLILPDDFADWDLLLDDARVYELPSLADAIRQHPQYQRRCFTQSLPQGVMLRWVQGASSAPPSAAAAATKKDDAGQQQQQQPPNNGAKIELFPPLQFLAVDPTDGCLKFQDRAVQSVDEAVSILLFTFQMHVEVWHRDTVGSASRISHTIFFTRK